MRLEEQPNVLERLFEHGGEVYGHILQVQYFLVPHYSSQSVIGTERIATAQGGPHYEQKKTNTTQDTT